MAPTRWDDLYDMEQAAYDRRKREPLASRTHRTERELLRTELGDMEDD